MHVDERKFSVPQLVEALVSGHLSRNEEYQRGEAWSEIQKAGFVDSILRKYPVPALFLHQITSTGLDQTPMSRYEIVDGQQRLNALRDYVQGKFSVPELGEKSKLRLPEAVRRLPAPWAGRPYSELPMSLREAFDATEISVFVIGSDTHAEEVRDLFIRLQSGTALSRQQVRDAWPGKLGPFVEVLAGKLSRKPVMPLFGVIDRRGTRNDDEDQKDPYVSDRQTCAQLLRVFIARESDPGVFPSVSANELDSLYHEHTDFDQRGPSAERFKKCLELASDIFKRAQAHKDRLGRGKRKFLRAEVSAVMLLLQDVTRDDLFKLDAASISALAQKMVSAPELPQVAGRSTSGPAIEKYYREWREVVAPGMGIRLDVRRTFDDGQKEQIHLRDGGNCQVCQLPVEPGNDEYDHHPVPHRLGGRTEITNGRLVHKACHERGRPRTEA